MNTDLKMLKIGYFRSMSFQFCLLDRTIEIMTDKFFHLYHLCLCPCQTMPKSRFYSKQFFRSVTGEKYSIFCLKKFFFCK